MPDLNSEFDAVIAAADPDEELTALPLWRRLFEAAEEQLARTKPGEYEVEDIGRLARSWLREQDVAEAFDTLSYTYWEAIQQEQANKLRWQMAQAASHLHAGDTETLWRDVISEPGGDVNVNRHMLRRLLKEVSRYEAQSTSQTGGAA